MKNSMQMKFSKKLSYSQINQEAEADFQGNVNDRNLIRLDIKIKNTIKDGEENQSLQFV
jgi:hypothetical protein